MVQLAPMNLEIDGVCAVVVGASRGIGRATAQLLAAEGARVALVARSEGELARVREEIVADKGHAETFVAAMNDVQTVDRTLDAITRSMGPPLIMVWSVTSFFKYQKLGMMPDEAILEQLHREVAVPTALVKRLVSDMMMARFGRLVFVGSLASRMATKGAPMYCVSKTAFESLARSIAVDYSRYGVTSNVARLGFTDTERLRDRIAHEPERATRYADAMSTRRLVTPREAASTIGFLCSRLAGSITGSVVDVTGGLELANHW